ncbi:MAG: hypothetical protein AAGJ46_11760 [Planctomycetota bacterium]
MPPAPGDAAVIIDWRRLLIFAAGFLAAAGCNPQFYRTPNFLHPGPAGPQQLDAIYHDPYPLDDVGPEIVGGRPRSYQRPVPETVRGRLVPPEAPGVGSGGAVLVPQTPSPTVVPPF